MDSTEKAPDQRGLRYGQPVEGLTLSNKSIRGAWLEEVHTDDLGTWHLIVVPRFGNLEHAHVEVRALQIVD